MKLKAKQPSSSDPEGPPFLMLPPGAKHFLLFFHRERADIFHGKIDLAGAMYQLEGLTVSAQIERCSQDGMARDRILHGLLEKAYIQASSQMVRKNIVINGCAAIILGVKKHSRL